VLVPSVVVLTVLAMVAGWAYWSTGSAPGGNGAAAATSLNQGTAPSGSASGSSVALTWSQTTLASGTAADGYIVRRYDAGTLAEQSVGASCTGTQTSTSCTESSVPDGQWVYSITPTMGSNWRGAESPKSTTVRVDTAAPGSSLVLSSVSGGAFRSGSTVFYRGVDAGSFRLTDTVTDPGSGPASSQTAALSGTSTGWDHTAATVSSPTGGPYVSNAFSWTAGTISAPSETVTSRDVAGNATTTTLNLVDDSTAPSVSTISYPDGFTGAGSVDVSFTTGTDGGSGIASRRLQRRVTVLNDGICGTFGRWSDIGPVGPSSPYTDSTIGESGCYQYQYVVRDNVGNVLKVSGTSTVKVSYSGVVRDTSGLLSYWRLGEPAESPTSADPFTDTAGITLQAHTGEQSTTWTRLGGTSGVDSVITDQNRVRTGGAGYTVYQASQTPASADYSVEADIHVKSTVTDDMLGVFGRLNSSTSSWYMARYENFDQSWNIVKVVKGKLNYGPAGSYVTNQPLSAGHNYRLRLEMAGSDTTTVKLFVNGVQTAVWADNSSPLTTAGRAGFFDGNSGVAVTKSNTTGLHLDNFEVSASTYARAADRQGKNTGDYQNGVTRGASGALAGDSNTAATFDGVNDHVQVAPTTEFPVGASVRSAELWFKTTAAKKQALFAYGTLANTREFGLWLEPDGLSMTVWGYFGDNSFPLAAAANDGAWHHVVVTYDGANLRLYLDGVLRGTQASTRDTAVDQYGFAIGAFLNPSDSGGNSGLFFNGSIDEVSFYSSLLRQSEVTGRYQLGKTAAGDVTGPTGGSVDATGLVGTGSRYSTSTSLSIALSTGTDPSGIASSGNELRRATATLTAGTCGSFGSYELVATDVTSPAAQTVADQACYRYRYLVADTHGNETAYTSPDIKVDTTAPSAPDLSFGNFTNTYWSGSGSTVYYRSAASSGSFRVTASASDAASDVISYAFPPLGTNWTATAGSLGVITYSWSGTPAAPGTRSVTATNNATGTSGGGAFTMVADDTAPSLGTLTVPDTTTSSKSVSIDFTTGSDSGSGIGDRFLQRQSAPLSGSTCGTYGGFATVTNGTNPTSTFTDTVERGTCYRYQYVVDDRVGNRSVTSSTSVVKVLTYTGTVSATSGLIRYWRMGESLIVNDFLDGTTGAGLNAARWSKHSLSDSDIVYSSGSTVRKSGTGTGKTLYTSTATMPSADYTIEAEIVFRSSVTGDIAGVVGRMDTANTNGTYYTARYEVAAGAWRLMMM